MVARVLVVDDDPDIRLVLTTTFTLAGFSVSEAGNGTEAVAKALKGETDAMLLDVLMPEVSGIDVLERLRSDARTEHLPVLVVSALTGIDEVLAGLQAGADDYIRKPFSPDEVVARVHSAIRRADRQRSRNPLTGLPGNDSILAELQRRIQSRRPTALLYVDADNFKAYNDYYGFLRGDAVLRELAGLLAGVCELAADDVFVGHVGGDDFVVMTSPEEAESLAATICARFDVLAPTLYDPAQRQAGGIVVADRRGEQFRYDIMTVSIGIAVHHDDEFHHPGQFVTVATEMKHVAKISEGPGSRFARDRRTHTAVPQARSVSTVGDR